ncbi:hypothetical protein E4U39_005336 [Claviceps sp. Clav50 group G5]|nr:hypothetical protein E4U39_005336 [Claviceps sp. Clav50 group G5]
MVADLSDDNRRVKQSKSSRGEPSRGKPAEESRTSVVMHKHIREVDGIPKVRLDSRLENRMERYATSSGDMARIHQDSFRFALDARGERREAGDEQRSLGLRLLSPTSRAPMPRVALPPLPPTLIARCKSRCRVLLSLQQQQQIIIINCQKAQQQLQMQQDEQ